MCNIKLMLKTIMGILRHLQHLRTKSLEYIEFLYEDIPMKYNNSITTISSQPSTSPDVSSPKYIYSTQTKKYYKLVSKRPPVSNIKDGEIIVGYTQGFETLTIKNDKGELVNFYPNEINKTGVNRLVLYNPSLDLDENKNYVWKIDYELLKENNILPVDAVVFARNYKTGKQIIPDVTFDDKNKVVIVVFDGTNNIEEYDITLIIIGSGYIF